jgi:hypothetical protein
MTKRIKLFVMHNIAYLYTQYDRGAIVVLFPKAPDPENIRIHRLAIDNITSSYFDKETQQSYNYYAPCSGGIESMKGRLRQLTFVKQPELSDQDILKNVLEDPIFEEASGYDMKPLKAVLSPIKEDSACLKKGDAIVVMVALSWVIAVFAAYSIISNAR